MPKSALAPRAATSLGWYDVRDYGLVGDGNQIYDGSMTNGSAVLTSASGKFSSSDVGKFIDIPTVGGAGAPLLTTIASFQSPTQVTLANAGVVTASSLYATWGSDNTAVLNTLVTTVFNAGGGVIYFPAAVFQFSGALTTHSQGSNGLINIPFQALNTSNPMISIEFRGAMVPRGPGAEVTAAPPSVTGTILRCTTLQTLTTAGNFFHCGHQIDATPLSWIQVIFRNLTIRIAGNNRWAAINASIANDLVCEHVAIDTNRTDTPVIQATNASWGIITPENLNGAKTRLYDCMVQGYNIGFLLQEHTDADTLIAFWCAVGIQFRTADHAMRIGRALIVWCPIVIQCVAGLTVSSPAVAVVTIAQLDIEDATAAHFYSPGNHIDDASNFLCGRISILRVVAGTGKVFTPLTVNGGSKLELHYQGSSHEPSASATTVTAAAGANAGTSPPAPISTSCDDRSGTVTFGTGTTPAAGVMVTIPFGTAYGVTPRSVIVTPNNAVTQALGLYAAATTTTLTVSAATAPSASQGNTIYSFSYSILGQ